MKITKQKLKDIIKEEIKEILSMAAGDFDDYDIRPTKNYGGEGSMVVNQLNRMSQIVDELQSMAEESDNHEEWVESKITKAHDYLSTVLNHLSGADADFDPSE